MEPSSQSKTIKINYVYVLIILLFAGAAVYFGIRTSRLSAKMEKDIAAQAVLKAQRDSIIAKATKLESRVVVLEAQVQQANKNTATEESKVRLYKSKYLELKNKPDVPCDTVLQNCDSELERYENFVEILKANVASYGRLADTLQLQNDYLKQANEICTQLTGNQSDELTTLRKQARKHKIALWGSGGIIAGMLAILLLQ